MSLQFGGTICALHGLLSYIITAASCVGGFPALQVWGNRSSMHCHPLRPQGVGGDCAGVGDVGATVMIETGYMALREGLLLVN